MKKEVEQGPTVLNENYELNIIWSRSASKEYLRLSPYLKENTTLHH
jgi:hypothetical protein